jgi:hypothetical protein
MAKPSKLGLALPIHPDFIVQALIHPGRFQKGRRECTGRCLQQVRRPARERVGQNLPIGKIQGFEGRELIRPVRERKRSSKPRPGGRNSS